MKFESLIFETQDKISIIKINRPKALNALNTKVLEELDVVLDEISKDENIFVTIITGEGKAFVAGADILEMWDMNPGAARKFSELGQKVFRRIELMEKPVIAAVNGFSLGGGCELAMCCDMRIASDKAKFGMPETGLGIMPGFGGTQRLSRLAGPPKAKELIFTGYIIDAFKAEKMGLVNKVVPHDELMKEALSLCEDIASKAQGAIRYSKKAINRGFESDIETGMAIENDLFGLCFAGGDPKEGMSAFLEKREPNFSNK